MNPLTALFGGGAASIVKAVGSAADSLLTSDEERARAEIELRRLGLEERRLADRGDERQVAVNREEARHRSVFVAGWRPAIGWICGASMAYHFLLYPLAGPFVEAAAGITLVDLDWPELSVVLLGMLGMGGLRSHDKLRGCDTRTVGAGR